MVDLVLISVFLTFVIGFDCPMGMYLDAGAHPGLMGALKSPRAAPPAYLRSRARR